MEISAVFSKILLILGLLLGEFWIAMEIKKAICKESVLVLSFLYLGDVA
jgi:hypothetical protein